MLTITANHQQAAAIVYIWLHVSNKIIIHKFKIIQNKRMYFLLRTGTIHPLFEHSCRLTKDTKIV